MGVGQLPTQHQPPTPNRVKRSLLLGLALTTFSLALHFLPIWVTMLNRGPVAWDGAPLTQDYIAQVIEDHRSGPDISFRRRPLTTWCLDALSSTGIAPKTAFVAWGFALFFLSGLLIRALALSAGSGGLQASIAQAAFHLSPTVLCAWFDPMYTYDEPLQYAAFLAALLAAMCRQNILAVLAMAVSLIAHETSAFLLPAFLLLPNTSWKLRWTLAAAPIALFILFLIVFLPSAGIASDSAHDALLRLETLAFNFSSPAMAAETIGYLLMTLLLPTVLLLRTNRDGTSQPWLMRAFWIALVLNTAAVLVAAKAREARVFALPLLLGWPLLGAAISAQLDRLGGLRAVWRLLRRPLRMALLICGVLAIHVAVRHFFPLSTNVPGDNLWHEYLSAQLVAVAALLWLERGSAPRPPQLEVPA